MTFHLICVHIIFSSVLVAEWPHFGKELLPRLTIDSLCIWLFVILDISRFGFEGWIWVLIASVPDLGILFTFKQDACGVNAHTFISLFMNIDKPE